MGHGAERLRVGQPLRGARGALCAGRPLGRRAVAGGVVAHVSKASFAKKSLQALLCKELLASSVGRLGGGPLGGGPLGGGPPFLLTTTHPINGPLMGPQRHQRTVDGAHERGGQRKWRKNARMSPTSRSGTSMAAK